MAKEAARWISIALGIAWCVVAVSKIALPDQLAYYRAAHRLGTNASTVRFLFNAVALAELAIGLALLWPRGRGFGIRGSLVTAAAFLVYAAWAGSETDSCGCIGRAVTLAGMPRFWVALLLAGSSYVVLRSSLPRRQWGREIGTSHGQKTQH